MVAQEIVAVQWIDIFAYFLNSVLKLLDSGIEFLCGATFAIAQQLLGSIQYLVIGIHGSNRADLAGVVALLITHTQCIGVGSLEFHPGFVFVGNVYRYYIPAGASCTAERITFYSEATSQTPTPHGGSRTNEEHLVGRHQERVLVLRSQLGVGNGIGMIERIGVRHARYILTVQFALPWIAVAFHFTFRVLFTLVTPVGSTEIVSFLLTSHHEGVVRLGAYGAVRIHVGVGTCTHVLDVVGAILVSPNAEDSVQIVLVVRTQLSERLDEQHLPTCISRIGITCVTDVNNTSSSFC